MAEPIQGGKEVILVDRKVVGSLLLSRPGVIFSSMFLNVGIKAVGIRILFTAQKQGVFQQVGKPWPLIWLLITARIDGNGR